MSSKGSGKIIESFDEYYEYYNLYSVEKIEIIKKLSHSEVIKLALTLNGDRLYRFISGYKLHDDEILNFKNKFEDDIKAIQYIEYYQENKKDAFTKKIR